MAADPRACALGGAATPGAPTVAEYSISNDPHGDAEAGVARDSADADDRGRRG